MTRSRLLSLTAAGWASLTATWWLTHPQEGLGQALLLTSLVVGAAAILWRCSQAAEEREWRIGHDADHAEQDRTMRGLETAAREARTAAVRSASERVAEVRDLNDWRRDHVRDPDAHSRRTAVPAQREEER